MIPWPLPTSVLDRVPLLGYGDGLRGKWCLGAVRGGQTLPPEFIRLISEWILLSSRQAPSQKSHQEAHRLEKKGPGDRSTRLQPVLDYAVWAEEANANETIRMLPAQRPSPVPGSVTVGHLLPHSELWNGGTGPCRAPGMAEHTVKCCAFRDLLRGLKGQTRVSALHTAELPAGPGLSPPLSRPLPASL